VRIDERRRAERREEKEEKKKEGRGVERVKGEGKEKKATHQRMEIAKLSAARVLFLCEAPKKRAKGGETAAKGAEIRRVQQEFVLCDAPKKERQGPRERERERERESESERERERASDATYKSWTAIAFVNDRKGGIGGRWACTGSSEKLVEKGGWLSWG
jgi:hypothetical protein